MFQAWMKLLQKCEKYTESSASNGRDAAEKVVGKYCGSCSASEPWAAIIEPILD